MTRLFIDFNQLIYYSLDVLSLTVQRCANSSIYWIPSLSHNISISKVAIQGCESISFPSFTSFYGFTELKELNLVDNHLDKLPYDWFYFSPNLEQIDLSRNKFEILPIYPNKIGAKSVKSIMAHNPIKCNNCRNSQLYNRGNFAGVSCSFPQSCKEDLSLHAYSTVSPEKANSVSKYTGSNVMLSCDANSTSVTSFAFGWLSKIGFVPDANWFVTTEFNQISYTLLVRPILRGSNLQIISNNVSSFIQMAYLRGFLSSDWFCLAHTTSGLYISQQAVNVAIKSTFPQVFNICLSVGFTVMFALLLIGIIGGTIRYLVETNCCSKRQPHYKYCGQKFVGVIPVPLYEDDLHVNQNASMENDTLSPFAATRNEMINFDNVPMEQNLTLPTIVDDQTLTEPNKTWFNADVKLVITDPNLVESYCEELDQLQKARLHPSYDYFYEKLHTFRVKVKEDAGKFIKVMLHEDSSRIQQAETNLPPNQQQFFTRFMNAQMVDRMKISITQFRDQLNNLTDLCSNAISLPMHSRLLFGQTIFVYTLRSASNVCTSSTVEQTQSKRERTNSAVQEVKVAEYFF
ncbi:hypothetical protein Ciccas_009873 [Cichlidogyrus casuarinus]|uniref:Uncharacterized protein n=1 Tax=Cichlidogyrus casuarinus TaxID=1844966 RepID=A0ABD2PWT1_9PLAT